MPGVPFYGTGHRLCPRKTHLLPLLHTSTSENSFSPHGCHKGTSGEGEKGYITNNSSITTITCNKQSRATKQISATISCRATSRVVTCIVQQLQVKVVARQVVVACNKSSCRRNKKFCDATTRLVACNNLDL